MKKIYSENLDDTRKKNNCTDIYYDQEMKWDAEY